MTEDYSLGFEARLFAIAATRARPLPSAKLRLYL